MFSWGCGLTGWSEEEGGGREGERKGEEKGEEGGREGRRERVSEIEEKKNNNVLRLCGLRMRENSSTGEDSDRDN